jgi:hypothetical protein
MTTALIRHTVAVWHPYCVCGLLDADMLHRCSLFANAVTGPSPISDPLIIW